MHVHSSVQEKHKSHLSSDWLDRDLSLLAFNARVLDWAKRADVPLLERLRYLCIVSSNLDEFLKYVRPFIQALQNRKPHSVK